MKLQFGATCSVSVFKKEDVSRKFKPVFLSRKVKGLVLMGEPRSLTIGNGRNPEILVFIEPYQTYKWSTSKDVAYLEILGNFLADV